MKVKDLIAQLMLLNPEAEIREPDAEDIPNKIYRFYDAVGWIDSDDEEKEICENKENSLIL